MRVSLAIRVGCGRQIARTRLRAPAVHFAAIANCSSVAKLVQPAAQGNTPGAGFLAGKPCVHFGDVRARRRTTRAFPYRDCQPAIRPSLLSFSSNNNVLPFTSPPNEGWMERRQAHSFFLLSR